MSWRPSILSRYRVTVAGSGGPSDRRRVRKLATAAAGLLELDALVVELQRPSDRTVEIAAADAVGVRLRFDLLMKAEYELAAAVYEEVAHVKLMRTGVSVSRSFASTFCHELFANWFVWHSLPQVHVAEQTLWSQSPRAFDPGDAPGYALGRALGAELGGSRLYREQLEHWEAAGATAHRPLIGFAQAVRTLVPPHEAPPALAEWMAHFWRYEAEQMIQRLLDQ